MKKNKLYTANRWNQPAFLSDRRNNLFLGEPGYSSIMQNNPNAFGVSLSAPNVYQRVDWSNPIQRAAAIGTTAGLVNGFKDIALADSGNPFGLTDSKGNINNGGFNLKGAATAVASGLAGTVGNMLGNAIRGDYDTGGVGKGISTVGNAVGDALGVVPGVGTLASAAVKFGSGLVGGAIDRAFGVSTDEKKLAAANQSISELHNTDGNKGSLDDITGPVATASVAGTYKNGWFTNKGSRMQRALEEKIGDARQYAFRAIDNNISNLTDNQINDALANYSALGGPLEYSLAMDYLTMKNKEAENRGKAATPPLMPVFMPNQNAYAIGGDLQTNGADFSDGLTIINAGLSHEENPNEGVQMGVDPEGVPNLVEEGEVIWNDYVFSNRIELDEEAKKIFHFPKKTSLTYAKAAKKLEKEISERPNDPISKAGFEAQMQALEEQQERHKQEMEAERAKAAFEALSPEEQVAVMESAAQQEQMAQEAAMQQEAMAQQQAQPSPEEQAMMQQQMVQADGSQTMVGQETPMMAEGGHLYKDGGDKKKNVGTWKDDKENHWDVFTKPGLKRYIENIRQRLAMAPNDETKAAIRREVMNELNTLQQSYYDYVRDGAANAVHGYDDNVLNHQKMFDRLYGNTGFYTTDENGNVRNLIADAINLPNGAATEDKPNNWFDGYNGPRTSIRNFGSTAYGDDKYYQDLVNEFKELGLTYAPNDNWKYNNGTLYGLSIPEEEAAKEAAASAPKSWDWNTGDWIDRASVKGTVASAVSPEQKAAEAAKAKEEQMKNIKPKYKHTMFGIEDLGPFAALTMQGLGIGRGNTSGLEAAANSAGNYTTASWMPRGDFMRLKLTDPWRYTMPILASSRATDRALMNSSSPSRMAGLLANGYNTQIALGEAALKGDDVNWQRYVTKKAHDADVYKSNQGEYGQTSRFNASAYNDASQRSAQLRYNAAQAKMAADNDWYGSLYANVGNIFDNFSKHKKYNDTHNMIADMAANGLFGIMSPESPIAKTYLQWENQAAKGGKIKKGKRRGLTF